ncbi:hypothetical protein [Desulfurella sp.]
MLYYIKNGENKMQKVLFFMDNIPLKQYLKAVFESNFVVEESFDIKRILEQNTILDYKAIIIGKNFGILTKAKLCEAIADFAQNNNHKILIFMLKAPNEKLPKRCKDIFIVNMPNTHEKLSKILKENQIQTFEQKQLKDTTQTGEMKELDLYKFFHYIKDNQKVTALVYDKKLEFLTSNGKFFILRNDFEDFKDFFLNTKVKAAYHEFNTFNFAERISIEKFKQISIREFIKQGLENILDEKHLYKLLPENKTKISVKANLYVLKDLLPKDSQININWLHKHTDLTIEDVLKKFDYLKSLRDIVIMYFAKAIDLLDPANDSNFDLTLTSNLLSQIKNKIQSL